LHYKCCLRKRILLEDLGCNSTFGGHSICDFPFTFEDLRNETLMDALALFKESCPRLTELGYRAFCELPEWDKMKGCVSDTKRVAYEV
jgi:hypothetical protein